MTNVQPVRLAYSSHEPVSEADPSLHPILFLHGLTACKEHWGIIPQVVANASKRKVYALDSRNHGDTEWSDTFNFDINASDLIHFMDSFGINKAIIVGHSMGGITAIKTALEKPQRVEMIIVEDMGVRKISSSVSQVLAYVSILRKAIDSAPSDVDEDNAKNHIFNYLKTNLPSGLVEVQKLDKTDLEEKKRLFKLRRGEDGRYRHKANLEIIEKALQDRDALWQDVQGIFEGPAYFIYGKLSPILVGADEHYIKQFFPSASFIGIEEAGHDIHNEKPLEFTDVLLKCLS